MADHGGWVAESAPVIDDIDVGPNKSRVGGELTDSVIQGLPWTRLLSPGLRVESFLPLGVTGESTLAVEYFDGVSAGHEAPVDHLPQIVSILFKGLEEVHLWGLGLQVQKRLQLGRWNPDTTVSPAMTDQTPLHRHFGGIGGRRVLGERGEQASENG